MPDSADLTPRDLERLEAIGIAPQRAADQLRRLARPAAPLPVLRPCRPGDGVERLPEERQKALEALWREAAGAGRFSKFVPASGAATRMLAAVRSYLEESPPPERRELEKRAAEGDAAASEIARLVDHLGELAFAERLASSLAERLGVERPLDRSIPGVTDADRLEALVAPWGLDLERLPKALIEFHRSPAGPRTALEEQFVEALGHLAVDGAHGSIHCTVAPQWRRGFESVFEGFRERLERRGTPLELALSVQSPATDTLALDAASRPARDAEGRLLLRPGGHGALLGNLEATGGDLVYVKNIDNIAVERLHPLTARWKRILGGRLVELERRAADLAPRLASDAGLAHEAVRFLTTSFALEPPAADPAALAAWAAGRLERPIRVAGVVPSSGEPGGGPFWVAGAGGGAGGQIVEETQIGDDPAGRAAWRGSTHFNPVDLVCALRDHRGRPHALAAWVDPDAYFVARKLHDGAPLRCLELPGLWNGAMSGWNTAFVEVPAQTFHPVKTLADLLRPAHRSGDAG